MTTTRLLLVAVLAVACGDPAGPPDDGTNNKPPSVAKITYATDSALVFTSKVVPVRALVKAFDATGNELPSSRLALTLPSGWTLRNDSIVAPSIEQAFKFIALAKPSGGASYATGEVVDPPQVTSGLDLRTFTWTATWKCVQPTKLKIMMAGPNNVYIDSSLYSATIDSTSYGATTADIYTNYGGIASMWYKGTHHVYLRDGTDFISDFSDRIPIRRQAPDSIIFDPFLGNVSNADEKLVRNGDSYAGGSWCSKDFVAGQGFIRGPVTLVRTLKIP